MKSTISSSYFDVEIDPTDHWPDVERGSLLGLGGLMNDWLLQYATSEMPTPIKEYLEGCYPFGVHEMTGGVVDPDLPVPR